jgi:hypothetical protein
LERATRSRPTPVFFISFNCGTMLRKSVEALRGPRSPTDIVARDNGSTDLLTVKVPSDLEQDGVRIFRRDAISSPDELNKVQDTFAEFFADWAEPARFSLRDWVQTGGTISAKRRHLRRSNALNHANVGPAFHGMSAGDFRPCRSTGSWERGPRPRNRSELNAKGNIGADRTLRFMCIRQRKYNASRHEGRRCS